MELKGWQMEFNMYNRKVPLSLTQSLAEEALCNFAKYSVCLCGKYYQLKNIGIEE